MERAFQKCPKAIDDGFERLGAKGILAADTGDAFDDIEADMLSGQCDSGNLLSYYLGSQEKPQGLRMMVSPKRSFERF